MAELVKIREVSAKYDISARALRYYEDMGLISNTRSEDYAYRMYDKQTIQRLEQILILRKLNISIKDIRLIFQLNSSEVILDVLGKKVEHIDGEVALLQDLKDIILEFTGQIKKADFSRDADVKRLYERAAKVESRITNIRIIQINPFKAFSSGADTIENVMSVFQEWQEEHNHLVRKRIYAAAMSVDGDDDIVDRIYSGILKWLEDSGFELDERPGRRTMCHMVNPTGEIKNALGYDQLDIYVPIKIRSEKSKDRYHVAERQVSYCERKLFSQ